MKKVLALVVAFGLGFALMGCEMPTTAPEGDDTTPVVEEVTPEAEVVEVTLPTEEAVVEDVAVMDGEIVIDEVEIVETPAE